MKLLHVFAAVLMTAFTQALALDNPYAALNGTMTPITLPDSVAKWWPDSLRPVYINHVGRHGARYLSGENKVSRFEAFLLANRGNLTPRGQAALALIDTIRARTAGRWGALTQLGRDEETRIAAITARLCPDLLQSGRVVSISSWVPRVVESQYAFCLEWADCFTHLEIATSEGRQYDPLMRPFDYDTAYHKYRKDGPWKAVYEAAVGRLAPTSPIRDLLVDPSALTDGEAEDLALEFYGILQGMEASEIPCEPQRWFSIEEYEACARLSNYQRYFRNSDTPTSTLASQSARALALDLLTTAEEALRPDSACRPGPRVVANLRFGHDETLMPLTTLMEIETAYSPGAADDIEAVWREWPTAKLYPLAANLQIFYLEGPSGQRYVAVMYCEVPVRPWRDAPALIIPQSDFDLHLRTRI